MLVGIHQPHYLPWPRYFEKIDACDAFIVLDTVQYSKNGWQNRNKIKGPGGEQVLTVPVHAHLDGTIADVRIDATQRWHVRHLKAIRQHYRAAPHFEEVMPGLSPFYEGGFAGLAELNRAMLSFWAKLLGIETPIYAASEIEVDGEATRRIANLVKAVGGTAYYGGAYGLEVYLDEDLLRREGIALELQRWTAPVYPQRYGAFVPDLSILDLVMNAGPGSLALIRRGGARAEPRVSAACRPAQTIQ